MRLLGVFDVRVAAEAVVLCRPGSRRPDRDGVRPRAEQGGDVGRLVHGAELIGRPSRLHDLVVDVSAVDRGLIDADGAGVEDRPAHLAVEVELAAGGERARGRVGIRERDGRGGPLPLGEEARDDAARRAPLGCRAIGSRHADAELDLLARGERGERPGYAGRVAPRELEGVHAVRAAKLELGARLDPSRRRALGDPADRRLGVGGVLASIRRVDGDARHDRCGHIDLSFETGGV